MSLVTELRQFSFDTDLDKWSELCHKVVRRMNILGLIVSYIEDICQEAVLACINANVPPYYDRGEYLRRIIWNKGYDVSRRIYRDRRIKKTANDPSQIPDLNKSNPQVKTIEKQGIMEIRKCLDKAEGTRKEVMRLFLAGIKQTEISKILEITEGTVAYHKKRMYVIIEEHFNGLR